MRCFELTISTAPEISGGRSFLPPIERTRPTTNAIETGFLRQRVEIVRVDAAELHARALSEELEERSIDLARRDVPDLLNELSSIGFAWRDLAKMIGVSIPAMQKWRKGERATGENRLKIAELLSVVRMLEAAEVQDPASWFEIPLRQGYPVTPIEMCAKGRADLVLEWGMQHAQSADGVLDAFDPNWRHNLDDRFESFVAHDGDISIGVRTD